MLRRFLGLLLAFTLGFFSACSPSGYHTVSSTVPTKNDYIAYIYEATAIVEHLEPFSQFQKFIGNQFSVVYPDGTKLKSREFSNWYEGFLQNLSWAKQDITSIEVLELKDNFAVLQVVFSKEFIKKDNTQIKMKSKELWTLVANNGTITVKDVHFQSDTIKMGTYAALLRKHRLSQTLQT